MSDSPSIFAKIHPFRLFCSILDVQQIFCRSIFGIFQKYPCRESFMISQESDLFSIFLLVRVLLLHLFRFFSLNFFYTFLSLAWLFYLTLTWSCCSLGIVAKHCSHWNKSDWLKLIQNDLIVFLSNELSFML